MQPDVHGYKISTIGEACFGIHGRTVAHATNTGELEGHCARL